MKSFSLVFLMILFSVFFSCKKNNETNKKNNVVSESENPQNIIEATKPDSLLIIGIWQRTNKKMWLEFKGDGTFNFGKEHSLLDSNRSWKIDNAKKKLYIDFSKGAKYLDYSVNNKILQITMQEKGKNVDFYRIAIRPDLQKP